MVSRYFWNIFICVRANACASFHDVCTIKFDIKQFLFDCHTNWLDLIGTIMFMLYLWTKMQSRNSYFSRYFLLDQIHIKITEKCLHFLKIVENNSDSKKISIWFCYFQKMLWNILVCRCCPNDHDGDTSMILSIGITPWNVCIFSFFFFFVDISLSFSQSFNKISIILEVFAHIYSEIC